MNPGPVRAEVLVFGSLNMDLAVRVPRVPEAGETLQARSLLQTPGGKGANQAVACARLGAKVAMVGRVGDDAFGLALKAALEADGVDTGAVATDAAPTGVALIMVDDGAQNRIALVPGANASVSVEDARQLRPLLEHANLVSLQLEVPMPAVCEAAAQARASGCTVLLNPAPARPLPDALWKLVDILVLNETEAALLGGLEVRDIAGAAQAAELLRRRGPAQVILTLGSQGAVVASAEGCRHFAALSVQAIDTTAAGDTFIGALCAALAQGAGLDVGISLGIQAAAVCVTREGAQISMPHRDELAAMPSVGTPGVLTVP